MVRLQRLEMSPSVSHSAAFMREKITDGSFNVDMQIDRTHTYKHCSSWWQFVQIKVINNWKAR